MNKNCYRIVFNAPRGQFVAVAETVCTHGSGNGTAPASAHKVAPIHVFKWRVDVLAAALASVALMVASPLAQAQVVSDAKAAANLRPVVTIDSAGRDFVNIQTPSAAGVSRNAYSQFDVRAAGVVLNNTVASNPHLKAGAAKIILNEVNAPAPSVLAGPLSVAGVKAHVVVANPNGIQVNGGSFVNANRVTLTTGKAVLDNGALSAIDVRGGKIEILANGMNAKGVPYTEILARAVTLAGRVDADPSAQVDVTAGANLVYSATGALTTTTAVGTKPTVAVDTSALGGMYAGKIRLIATEAGVGIRNAGTLQGNTTSGSLQVSSNGWLENAGTMDSAVTSAGTVAGNVTNTGKLLGRNALLVSSGNDFNQTGTGMNQATGTVSNVMVHAKRHINVNAGASISSNAVAAGSVSLSAGQNIYLRTGSNTSATSATTLDAGASVVADGAIATSKLGATTVTGGAGIQVKGGSITGRTVHLETGAPFVATAAPIVLSAATVNGTDQTTVMASGDLTIQSPSAALRSDAGFVHLQSAKNLTVQAGSTLKAGKNLTVLAAGNVSLMANAVRPDSGTVVDVVLQSGADMKLSGAGVTASGSQLTSGGALAIEATTTGVSLMAQPNAKKTRYDSVRLQSVGDLTVSAPNGVIHAEGLQATGQNVHIVSGDNLQVRHVEKVVYPFVVGPGLSVPDRHVVTSNLVARGNLSLGSVGPSGWVSVDASNVTAAGKLRLFGNASLNLNAATHVATNSSGTQVTSGVSSTFKGAEIQVQSRSVGVMGSSLSTTAPNGDIRMVADGGAARFEKYLNKKTTFNATRDVALYGKDAVLHDSTQITAMGSASSHSANGGVTATAANVKAGDIVSFASKGAQTHTNGQYNGGVVNVHNDSGALTLNGSTLAATTATRTSLASVSGAVSVHTGGELLTNSQTRLSAATDLSIVKGVGDMVVDASALSQWTFGRDLTLATRNGNMTLPGTAGMPGATAHIPSTHVTIKAPRNLSLLANNVTLQGSELRAGGILAITATTGNTSVTANRSTKYEAGFTNTYWDRAVLSATKGIDIRSRNDTLLQSVWAHTKGKFNATSGRHTNVAAQYTLWKVDNRDPAMGASGGWLQEAKTLRRSEITGEAGIELGAMGGNLTVNGALLKTPNAQATLQALGHVHLQSGQNHVLNHRAHDWSYSDLFGKYYRVTHTKQESLTPVPVDLQARDVLIKAGNNIQTDASRLSAGNWLKASAGDAILYGAQQAQVDNQTVTHKENSIIGIPVGSGTETILKSTLTGIPTTLRALNGIYSGSGADQVLQGTEVHYGAGGATFQAGVGEKARADARIILEGVKSTISQQRLKESNYVVWQSQVNQGSATESLVLPSFNGPVEPVFKGPVLAQIPAGDFKTQLQSLATQPGMEYLKTLSTRSDVNWQAVELASRQWNYKQQGLTGAGAAIVSAALAWATGGVGASLLGTTGTTTSLMANVAFTSLTSQATITFINNGGDLGKTLKALGDSDIVKATLTAVLTAGALDKINGLSSIKALAGSSAFTDQISHNLINAGGRALTYTAINGGSLEDALKSAIVGGLVDTVHGNVASHIKGLEANYLAHKLAHALAGCVAGEAAGGTCKSGAIGAAVGEVVAGLMPPANGIAYSPEERAKVLAYSKIVAGATSAYAGGNAQTAITTAETAVTNNALVPALVGLAWLADKAWTAYEVAQDVAAIRDGTKTVAQVAQEKGEAYVTGIIMGNVGRYGIKAVKTGAGAWTQSKDNIATQITENRGLAAHSGKGMLGASGTQMPSTSVWHGDGKERIDVENPAPGQRPGQIHYQDNKGGKYYYQPLKNIFTEDPQGKIASSRAIQKLLENQKFLDGINKAMRYLGEKS